jgi:hypothetical protein
VGCRFERGINRSYLGMTFATGTFGVGTPQGVPGYEQVIFGGGYMSCLYAGMNRVYLALYTLQLTYLGYIPHPKRYIPPQKGYIPPQ